MKYAIFKITPYMYIVEITPKGDYFVLHSATLDIKTLKPREWMTWNKNLEKKYRCIFSINHPLTKSHEEIVKYYHIEEFKIITREDILVEVL